MNIVSDKQKRMRVVHTMLRVENIFTFFIERSIVGMKGNAWKQRIDFSTGQLAPFHLRVL